MSCQKETSSLKVAITPILEGTVMDPSRVYFLNEYYLIENLTLRLVEMDANSGYELLLASEINPISDTEYSIKIKESYFSNGDLITLKDVMQSLDRASRGKNSHIKFSEILHSMHIKDDALILKLKKRTNDFFYYLTLIDLSILHSSQLKDEILAEDWQKVTSGPFLYYLENGKAYLLKNRYYKLSDPNYPDKISLLSAMGRNSFEDFKNGVSDLGEFNLNSYEKHLDEISKYENLHVIGNTGDMITFLALNVRSPLFKNEKTRRWILKKIISRLSVPPDNSQVARKAYQFFTPQVRGFLDEKEILNEVNSWKIDLKVVPEEIKDGFTISTYKRAFEVTLRKIVEQMSSILEIPVVIEDNVASPDFEQFMIQGKFQSFLAVTSMDQIIVGESINLYYFSSFPMLQDVNGKIKKLMNEYKYADISRNQIVKKIALQMIKDAECIPMFYVASPFYFNSRKVDVSNLDELTYFNLWKLKVVQ